MVILVNSNLDLERTGSGQQVPNQYVILAPLPETLLTRDEVIG